MNRKTNTVFADNTLADAIKFLAKVIPCPFVPQGYTSFGKFLHSSLRSGSKFSKNLAGQDTELRKAKNLFQSARA